jgi:TRAP-type C4-dicarboxylate transport system substrate-binding protein
MIRTGLKAILLCAVPMLLLGSPASAETKLLFNNFVPETHPLTHLLKAWAARVAKATDDRVVIEFPAATLAPPPRQWDMITKNIADGGWLFNAFESKRLALVQMYHLPFITPSGEAAGIAMNRTQAKYFAKANEYAGIHLLGQFSFVGNSINMANKPVHDVADLKGVKIRTSPGIGKDIFEALGAVVVTTPGARAFEVVSKGVVDGLAQSFADIEAFKMTPYVKYVTTVPGKIYNSGFSLMMNEKKWASLSAQDKTAIDSVSGELIGRDSRYWDEENEKAREIMVKAGIQIEAANPTFVKELHDRLGVITDEWLASVKDRPVDAKAALAYYEAEVQKVQAEIDARKPK